MHYDVVIVGAGPAGLAAAIRLKSLDSDISVVIVEKGSTVGAHILSGAVIDPIGLDRLTPDWRSDPECPLKTQVTADQFYFLTETRGVRLPNWAMPRLMGNHGNFIGSLGRDRALARGPRRGARGRDLSRGLRRRSFCTATSGRWSASRRATWALAATVIRRRDSRGGWSCSANMCCSRRARADRCRNRRSLATVSIPQAGRRSTELVSKNCGKSPTDRFSPGLVQHTFGWPLSKGASGGSFLYHYGDRLVSVGFVVHLNYENPTLSPFDEFQRFKTHPLMRETFVGGKRIAYGARVIASGGWQSVPKLVFPGGAFIGCSAGFVNFARIKGSHNAILSGMLAAEKACQALAEGRANDELNDYENSWRDSDIGRDLYKVRNVKPLWSRFGLVLGVGLGGLDMWTNELFKSSIFGTLKHGKPDSDTLKPISEVTPIVYPKPDFALTFDKAVFRLSFKHESRRGSAYPSPACMIPTSPIRDNLPRFGEPARLYCPAGVYEVVYANEADSRRPALCHQRAELCPLQNLRHQGPGQKHRVDPAGRRRRAELSGYVAVAQNCRFRLSAKARKESHFARPGDQRGSDAGAHASLLTEQLWESVRHAEPISTLDAAGRLFLGLALCRYPAAPPWPQLSRPNRGRRSWRSGTANPETIFRLLSPALIETRLRRRSTTGKPCESILEIPISSSAPSPQLSPMATNRAQAPSANGSLRAIRTTTWRALQSQFTISNKDNSRPREPTWPAPTRCAGAM